MMRRVSPVLFLLCLVGLTLERPAFAQTDDVLTQRGDMGRTSAYLNEKTLSPANVKTPTFHKLYFRFLDGNAYAQPLYVSGLTIGGKSLNVIYVATENNTVYAFEDDPTDQNPNKAPIWKVNLGPSISSVTLSNDLGKGDLGCVDLTTQIGITSTPVIDRTANVVYVVAKTKQGGSTLTRFIPLTW